MAVAVSAGADSVALLRVLLELRGDLGIVLAVAHFNHHLRGDDSDGDERFVAELAERHGLPFYQDRARVREHAASNKLSLEHAARELRYDWLIDLAQTQRFEAVATAHTRDDQAETVLMKFLRGAGTKGLAGIHVLLQRDGVRIVRPLLETRRAQVEQYLTSIGQPWREDETNRDYRFTRNRVRHELLPLLERDYNPNLRELLNQAAEVALAEEDYWRGKADCFLKQWQEHPGRLLLRHELSPPTGLPAEPLAVQRRVLKRFLEDQGLPTDFHHVEAVRHCALGETLQVELPGGWRARHQGDWLELAAGTPQASEPVEGYEGFLPIPGECVVAEEKLTIRATVVPSDEAANAPSGSLLSVAKIGPKLLIRNWLPGDRFRPAHTASVEKLKRLFSERRIPAQRRALWPIALLGAQIVWVHEFPAAHDFAWVPDGSDAVRIDVLSPD